MQLSKAVEHVGTVLELRRIAKAYAIDYKNLTDDELRAAIVKTAPQYYNFPDNVQKALTECLLDSSRDVRVITRLLLKEVLLNKDGFMATKREVAEEIVNWEQSVVNQSNESLFKRDGTKSQNLDMLKFVLETAWQNNDEISPDEKNLIDKIKDRLKITDRELCIIESKLSKFPKPGNQLHSHGEIDNVRQVLQSKGLLFPIRSEGTDFDIIPDELAKPLRAAFGVEIRKYGYRKLLDHKCVCLKSYFVDVLQKSGVAVEGQNSLEDLQEMLIEHVSPSNVIGGFSPKDGLSMETLAKWCADRDLNVSGSKSERIERIVGFYDNLRQIGDTGSVEDPREIWYLHYEAFAARNLEALRSQLLIQKDIETERKFEQATDYLFEHRLGVKPLTLVGTEHPDGALSFGDGLIYWDNKSRETPVCLKDHLRQFDQYIKKSTDTAGKKVACFLVIGPDFTEDSSPVAMQYRVENGVTITLITAEELKSLAEEWNSRVPKKADNPFPLGYLIQSGRFNRSLVAPL